jgi:hypothetical protein
MLRNLPSARPSTADAATASEPSPSLPGFGNGSPVNRLPWQRGKAENRLRCFSPLFRCDGEGRRSAQANDDGASSGSVQAWVHRTFRPVFHGVLFACSRESRPGAWSGCEAREWTDAPATSTHPMRMITARDCFIPWSSESDSHVKYIPRSVPASRLGMSSTNIARHREPHVGIFIDRPHCETETFQRRAGWPPNIVAGTLRLDDDADEETCNSSTAQVEQEDRQAGGYAQSEHPMEMASMSAGKANPGQCCSTRWAKKEHPLPISGRADRHYGLGCCSLVAGPLPRGRTRRQVPYEYQRQAFDRGRFVVVSQSPTRTCDNDEDLLGTCMPSKSQ